MAPGPPPLVMRKPLRDSARAIRATAAYVCESRGSSCPPMTAATFFWPLRKARVAYVMELSCSDS
jgi:hypothetical protein